MDAVRDRDEPWSRLAWHVPLAAVLTLVGLMSFLRLLEAPEAVTPAPRPLEVQVMEMPPPAIGPAPLAPSAPGASQEQAAATSNSVPGVRGGSLGGGSAGARAIYQPLPEIPEALRHRTVEITTVARFRVAANGSAQVELTEPTADPDLN